MLSHFIAFYNFPKVKSLKEQIKSAIAFKHDQAIGRVSCAQSINHPPGVLGPPATRSQCMLKGHFRMATTM